MSDDEHTPTDCQCRRCVGRTITPEEDAVLEGIFGLLREDREAKDTVRILQQKSMQDEFARADEATRLQMLFDTKPKV